MPDDTETKSTMPKPTPVTIERFRRVAGADPRVSMRPMFGNLAAFANGYLFAGLFGEDVFIRIGEPQADAVLAAGGRPFAPMPGRAMGGYLVLPEAWAADDAMLASWIDTTLIHTMALPPKPPKPPKAKNPKGGASA